ncbi:hypothetical protein ALC62_12869 [Cyphomyrmex costatus]|uniref:Uncharacterized protein n=1 Tax=Cyphomyrmex costatus TaxID=456900 RepID=A0A195C6N8_9HYME|nr:hypothetical protein ALC62_12869 [Cyphomyrmex costatus]
MAGFRSLGCEVWIRQAIYVFEHRARNSKDRACRQETDHPGSYKRVPGPKTSSSSADRFGLRTAGNEMSIELACSLGWSLHANEGNARHEGRKGDAKGEPWGREGVIQFLVAEAKSCQETERKEDCIY